MRLLAYRSEETKKRKNGTIGMSMEKWFFLIFVVVFTMMITAQAAILIPSTSSYIKEGNPLEGVPLGREEYLYETGEIELQLVSGNSNEKLKVLVNGDVKASFIVKKARLHIKKGDVIEIDASELETGEEISVKSLSPNIDPECINRKVMVESGIVEVARISLK